MKLYIQTTCDEYELIKHVCDTPQELALELGIKVNSLLSMISRKQNGCKRLVVEDD